MSQITNPKSQIDNYININPSTFPDLSNVNFWIPVMSDRTLFTLTTSPNGALIKSTNQIYAQLQSCLCGIVSRGKFFPQVSDGELDVKCNFDSYNSADDITATREWLIMAGFLQEHKDASEMDMAGAAYGSLPAAGKEKAIAFTFNDSGVSTNLTVNISWSAVIPTVPNGSSGHIRLKTTFKAKMAGGRQRFFYHAYIDMNGTTYGGDLGEANWKSIQGHTRGLYLFCGVFASVGSPGAKGQVKFTSIDMIKGMYMPSR